MPRFLLVCLFASLTASNTYAETPVCDVPAELKDARGCVSLGIVEQLAKGGCGLPNGFCFSIPYAEARAVQRVLVVEVIGKDASRLRAQAEIICKSLGRDQKMPCRVGRIKESADPARIKVKVVTE